MMPVTPGERERVVRGLRDEGGRRVDQHPPHDHPGQHEQRQPAVEDDEHHEHEGHADEAGEHGGVERVLAERGRHGLHGGRLDPDREGAAVDDAGQRAGLGLVHARDAHAAGERRRLDDGMGLDDVVEHDGELLARARLGALVALAGDRVPRRLAVAGEIGDDDPALAAEELDGGAVAAEDLAAAAGRPDEAGVAVDRPQELLAAEVTGLADGDLGRGRVVGAVAVGVRRRRRVAAWSARCADGTSRRSPTGPGGRRRRAVGRRRRRRSWRPAPSWCVAPATVVVVAVGSGARPHANTGRKVTMPATSTASSASCWSFTPGRSTTMLPPSTRTSGSAMPRFSSSSRIRSRMTMRSASDASPPSGRRMTETPPCRSSPRTGWLPRARLSAEQTGGDDDDPDQRRPEATPDHSLSAASASAGSSASSSAGPSSLLLLLLVAGRRRSRPCRPCPGWRRGRSGPGRCRRSRSRPGHPRRSR